MTELVQRIISLDQSQIDFIDAKVASGAYDSADDVVRAGLNALADHDPAFEDWLQREVIATYQAGKADPSRLKSSQETFEILRAHMANKLGKAAA